MASVRPEPVEDLVLAGLVVRQAHHERPNGLTGLNTILYSSHEGSM